MTDDQQMISLRIPKSALKRFDKIAEQMSRPGFPVNRTEAIRLALFEGASVLENEIGKEKDRKR